MAGTIHHPMHNVSDRERLADPYDGLRLKLLDLSKKNRMLNYVLGARSKRHLQIVDEVLEEVYKLLVDEEASLRILPLDEPENIPPEERTEDFVAALEHAKVSDIEYLTKLEALESQGRDDEILLSRLELELRDRIRSQLGLPQRPKRTEINRAEHARTLGIEPNPELDAKTSKPSHSDQALQTLKFPDELETVVGKLFDDARLAVQEMGLSTLFLAFGFIEWYESDDSDRKAFAPLLLLPVRLDIERVRGHQVFYLSSREDTAEPNLSLQKLLEKNFNRKLPDFETGENDKPTSVEEYLELVRVATEGLARWQVHRWLVLGHFAFGRFAMYADLNPENWTTDPSEHVLVSAILRGAERSDDEGLLPSVPEDYPIDEPEIEKIAPFLIQDADASQHSALIDVMRKKNLVIQGPPGTGKSQTITNIIANALAADKTVLFLAEKQAALEVVKRRLVRAGLGDFCLELHSDKSTAKMVIESLKQRAELSSGGSERPTQPADIAWHENRKEIRAYLSGLHATQPNGSTPFRLIWKALRGRSVNADIIESFKSVFVPTELLADLNKRATIENGLAVFSDASVSFAKSYGHHPAASAWADTTPGNIGAYQVSRLVDTLREIQALAAEIAIFIENAACFGVATTKDIIRVVEVDRALVEPPAADLLPEIVEQELDELDRAIKWVAELHDVTRALAERTNLSHNTREKLAAASLLMRAGLPEDLAEKTPAELYKISNATIRRNASIADLIDCFIPILRLFQLDHELPGGVFLPVSVAVQAGSKMIQKDWEWVNAYRGTAALAFWSLHKRWLTIATREIEWRGYLTAFGSRPWPEPADIELAAANLGKSGVSKAFAALSGATKAARQFASQFGFGASTNAAANLQRLALHVRNLREFESDGTALPVLGTSWKGLSTPFEEIATGIKLRELLLDRIGGLPYGAEVAERLVALPPNSSVGLKRFVVTAVEFCAAPNEIRGAFDHRSIGQLKAECRGEIAKSLSGNITRDCKVFGA
jgi:hypothetical protein